MNQTSNKNHPTKELLGIWAILAARSPAPSLIVVASATDDDDTTSIARGIAATAANSDQRTGYVRLNVGEHRLAEKGAYTELFFEPYPRRQEAFDMALAGWRSSFDIVVVDVTNVRSDVLAPHVIRHADAVIVAVCAGRRVTSADAALKQLLAELDSSVIGAVFSKPTQYSPFVNWKPHITRFESAVQP